MLVFDNPHPGARSSAATRGDIPCPPVFPIGWLLAPLVFLSLTCCALFFLVPYRALPLDGCCAAMTSNVAVRVMGGRKQKKSSGSSGMIEETSIDPATDVPYLDGDIKGKVT